MSGPALYNQTNSYEAYEVMWKQVFGIPGQMRLRVLNVGFKKKRIFNCLVKFNALDLKGKQKTVS